MPSLIDLHAVSAPVERRGMGGFDDALLDSLAGELALVVQRTTAPVEDEPPVSTLWREVSRRVDPGCAALPWPYKLPRLYKFAPVRRIEADLVRLRAELEIAVRAARRRSAKRDSAALPA